MEHPTRNDSRAADLAEIRWERYRLHGDLRALGELFDSCAPDLLRIGLRLTGELDAAEDLLQETFLRALRSAPRYRTRGGGVRSWLATILRNRARSASKRVKARSLDVEPTTEATEDPVERSSAGELWSRLRSAVAELPEPYRTVCGLRYRHDLDASGIAATLERPLNTVQSQLRRGTQRLRARLGEGAFGAVLAAEWSDRAALDEARSRLLQEAARQSVVTGTATLGGGVAIRLAALLLVLAAVGTGVWQAVGAAGAEPNLGSRVRTATLSNQEPATATAPDEEAPSSRREVLSEPAPEPLAPPESATIQVVDGRTGAPLPGAILRHARGKVIDGEFQAEPSTDRTPERFRLGQRLHGFDFEQFQKEFGASTTCDEQGRADLPIAVSWRVSGRLDSLYGELDRHDDLRLHGERSRLALYPDGFLSVRVLEPDGRPAAGVSVRLGAENQRNSYRTGARRTRTDAAGECSFPHVPLLARRLIACGGTRLVIDAFTASGSHRLATWEAGDVLAPGPDGNCSAGGTRTLRLPAARGPLTVRILDPLGNTPRAVTARDWAAGELLDIALSAPSLGEDSRLERLATRSGHDGTAEFARPPAGRELIVSCYYAGLELEQTVPSSRADSPPHEIVFRLPGKSATAWRGRAVDANGEPLRNRFLLQLAPEPEWGPGAGVATDANGQFFFHAANVSAPATLRLRLADVVAHPCGQHVRTDPTELEATHDLNDATPGAVHELGDVLFRARQPLGTGHLEIPAGLRAERLRGHFLRRLSIQAQQEDGSWRSVPGGYAMLGDSGALRLFGRTTASRLRIGLPRNRGGLDGYALPMPFVEFDNGATDLQLPLPLAGILALHQRGTGTLPRPRMLLERLDGEPIDTEQHYVTWRETNLPNRPRVHVIWHVQPGRYRVTVRSDLLAEPLMTFPDVLIRAGRTTDLLRDHPLDLNSRLDGRRLRLRDSTDGTAARARVWTRAPSADGEKPRFVEQIDGEEGQLVFPRGAVQALALPRDNDSLGIEIFDPAALSTPAADLSLPASSEVRVTLPAGSSFAELRTARLRLLPGGPADDWLAVPEIRRRLRSVPLRIEGGEPTGYAIAPGTWLAELLTNDGRRATARFVVPPGGASVAVAPQWQNER